MNIEKLLGCTVTKVLMSSDESHMRFHCKNGDYIDFITYAECCSETWFADM